jgi:hypothetical protein
MENNTAAVKWYKSRIQRLRREASALTIEVGLNAQENADPSALSETIRCLDSVIDVLQRARTIRDPHDAPSAGADAQRLMEDLGHSLAPLNFEAQRFRRIPRVPCRESNSGDFVFRVQQRGAWEDTLRFFQ